MTKTDDERSHRKIENHPAADAAPLLRKEGSSEDACLLQHNGNTEDARLLDGSLEEVPLLHKDGSPNEKHPMVADARELYLKYAGLQHKKIEREMRERGWPFHRSRLYARRNRTGRLYEGWPEYFGWNDILIGRGQMEGKRDTGREFEYWLKETFPEWTWTWRYQTYLYKYLARVTSGKCKRLMIFMPPRHGKSETVTVRYTAWRLLRDPRLNVILGSYNQRLVNRFSRKIRRVLEEEVLAAETGRCGEDLKQDAQDKQDAVPENHPGLRPPLLRKEGSSLENRARSVSEWETGGGGMVRAVGVGAGIAGFGAGLVVIDDPVRNRADAESETYRDRVWDWFNDDIYTRLEPKAAIILIQTRWHEDDLAGRLLREAEDGGEQWEVVKFAAIAEERQETGDGSGEAERPQSPVSRLPSHVSRDWRRPGEALCPERYDEKALERTRRKLGSYSFSALYQQDPVPARGVQFKREWFRQIVDEAPKFLRWKRGYDLAISIKTSADYTASFRCAYDKHGNLYIADGFRKRMEYPDQRRFIIERMRAERDTEHGIEAALHGKAIVQELRREPGVRSYAFKEVQVATDKLTRALAWLNLAEAGKLFLVRGPWIDEFVNEVCRFPHGRHDDQVDAVSIAVSMLSKKGNRAGGLLIY